MCSLLMALWDGRMEGKVAGAVYGVGGVLDVLGGWGRVGNSHRYTVREKTRRHSSIPLQLREQHKRA